ncbi:MAG: hypothetical protein WC852_04215 [Candidatus Nanoarchaeia archaeon]
MTLETNIKDEGVAIGIQTIAEPDEFVVNTEAEKVSLYAKLNTASEATTYDAWCRHSD